MSSLSFFFLAKQKSNSNFGKSKTKTTTAGWPEATGAVHHSPPFALRRKCGDGAAFTPVNENSAKDLGGPPTDRSVHIVCLPFVLVGRILGKVIDVLNSIAVQTFFYLAFVALFQLLTQTLRLKEEFHFDKMITGERMKRGGARFRNSDDGSPRFEMLQNSTVEAATRFPDEHFDWIYLDATHTYAEAKRDLEAWYPKVRPGGLVSGHDYQFQHQAIGDGYTFGVKDAVDEFASRRNTRVYATTESYLPSFYFLKCTRH